MVVMKKEEIEALFGTTDENEIKENKTTGKQIKVVGLGKPGTVKLSADECKKLCKAVGLEFLEGYEERVIEHIISDETKDRAGDIMRAGGVDFTNYVKNPTILFVHNGHDLPVGKSLKTWTQGKTVRSWGLYLDDRVDKSGRADNVFNFVKSGAMPAVSVGFIPKLVNYPSTQEERDKLGLGRYGAEYKEWELIEYSNCPVPCNPNALRRMIEEKSISKEHVKFLFESKLIPEELTEEVKEFTEGGIIEGKLIEGVIDPLIKTIQEDVLKIKETLSGIEGIKDLSSLIKELNETLKSLTLKPTDTKEVPSSEDDESELYSEVFTKKSSFFNP